MNAVAHPARADGGRRGGARGGAGGWAEVGDRFYARGGWGGGAWRGGRLDDGIVRWGQFWRRIS